MLEGAIQRLVSLCGRVPSDADRQDVRIRGARAFDGREIELDAFDGVLIILDAPAGDGRERRKREIALGIFQVFIAAEKFHPLAVFFLREDGAGDDGSRHRILWRFGDDVRGEEFLFAGLGQIAEDEDFRLLSEEIVGGCLNIVGDDRLGRFSGSFRGGVLRGFVAATRKKQRGEK